MGQGANLYSLIWPGRKLLRLGVLRRAGGGLVDRAVVGGGAVMVFLDVHAVVGDGGRSGRVRIFHRMGTPDD